MRLWRKNVLITSRKKKKCMRLFMSVTDFCLAANVFPIGKSKSPKKAAILVHARFDSVSLYRSTFDEIVFAAKLMRKSASEVEEIVKRYDRLPIRSSKEIRLDIQTVVPNKRSFVLHAVEKKF